MHAQLLHYMHHATWAQRHRRACCADVIPRALRCTFQSALHSPRRIIHAVGSAPRRSLTAPIPPGPRTHIPQPAPGQNEHALLSARPTHQVQLGVQALEQHQLPAQTLRVSQQRQPECNGNSATSVEMVHVHTELHSKADRRFSQPAAAACARQWSHMPLRLAPSSGSICQ